MTSTPARPLPSTAAVAKMIDHSLLRPELTATDVTNGLETAVRYATGSVCVRPADVPVAVAALYGTSVLVGTVVGFPHGSSTTRSKVNETRELVALGAEEIDMVINIGRLRSGDVSYVGDEIGAIVDAADARPVKVIFENAYLDKAEKVAGYQAAAAAGAAFIKTSTGFAPGGATAEDVALMRKTVPPLIGVKAAGGVRTLDFLLELHDLGATRFGATATATILDDLAQRLQGGVSRPTAPDRLADTSGAKRSGENQR